MPNPPESEFIVSEISKNWEMPDPHVRIAYADTGFIGQQFEGVIAYNLARGYVLHSFDVHRILIGTTMNETIVSVFQRKPKRQTINVTPP